MKLAFTRILPFRLGWDSCHGPIAVWVPWGSTRPPNSEWHGSLGPAPSQTVPKGFPSILEKQSYYQFVGAAYYSYGSPCDFPSFLA
jgi:hypothetical protein